MDPDVQAYIDRIDSANRPLFDRVQRLILALYPDAATVLSYKMPTYKRGKGRLFVAAWQHGISMYGWRQGSIDDFIAHHPKLRTSKGTIRLSTDDAAGVPDDELAQLIHAALAG